MDERKGLILCRCQDATAALLAAYVVQAEEGDYSPENYRDYTYLLKYKFLPQQDVMFLRSVSNSTQSPQINRLDNRPKKIQLKRLRFENRIVKKINLATNFHSKVSIRIFLRQVLGFSCVEYSWSTVISTFINITSIGRTRLKCNDFCESISKITTSYFQFFTAFRCKFEVALLLTFFD